MSPDKTGGDIKADKDIGGGQVVNNMSVPDICFVPSLKTSAAKRAGSDDESCLQMSRMLPVVSTMRAPMSDVGQKQSKRENGLTETFGVIVCRHHALPLNLNGAGYLPFICSCPHLL